MFNLHMEQRASGLQLDSRQQLQGILGMLVMRRMINYSLKHLLNTWSMANIGLGLVIKWLQHTGWSSWSFQFSVVAWAEINCISEAHRTQSS